MKTGPVKLKKRNPRSKFRDEFTEAVARRCEIGYPGELTPEQIYLVTDAIRSELNERICDAYREIEDDERRTIWSVPNVFTIRVTTRTSPSGIGQYGRTKIPTANLRLHNTYRDKLRAAGLTLRNLELKEHAIVYTTCPLTITGLKEIPQGASGTIVHCYPGRSTFEVEFTEPKGVVAISKEYLTTIKPKANEEKRITTP